MNTLSVILKKVVQMKRLLNNTTIKSRDLVCNQFPRMEFQFEMQKYMTLRELNVMPLVSTRSSARSPHRN